MLHLVLCNNITISDWITTLQYYDIDYFLHDHYFNYILLYCRAGKFGELTHLKHLTKESLGNYKSANRLLIVRTNLGSFSLANYGQFTKFAKSSYYMVPYINIDL